MEKKFFQNYTLTTFEEAVAVASVYVNALGNCNDMLFGNLFTEDKNVGNDNVDLSNCFLVTDDVLNAISDVVDKHKTFEGILKEYPDLYTLRVVFILRGLKDKMLGSSSLEDALAKDRDVFGDDVAFYSECPFVNMLKLIDLLG